MAVSGAGGFIGRAACRALHERGVDVAALVGPPEHKLPTPPSLAYAERATFNDADALDRICAGAVAVVHLAGPPSVRASFAGAGAYVEAHVGGTLAFLEAARRARVQRFVYVSSAEVYGETAEQAVTESASLDARSPYAAAKAGAEQMVHAYAHAYGMSAVILRPFSVYGPHMNEYGLVSAILRQLQAGGPVEVLDLRPVRDYVFVDDCAQAIAAAATAPLPGLSTFNVGTGVGTSVAELACYAFAACRSRPELRENRRDARPTGAEIFHLVADPARSREELGWSARTSLESGLRLTYESLIR